MELTKNIRRTTVLVIILFLVGGSVLPAQEPGQLGDEIHKLEQRLSLGISSAERHDALKRLAQLQQLSGNLAGAAAHWLDAVVADPRDDEALIAGAYCLAAIGEWEKAASILSPLLAVDKWGPSVTQAYYLNACLRAWTASDASFLSVLAERPDFVSLRPMIYYTLWQIISRNPNVTGAGGADSWKARLLADFPQSPEARAADPISNRNSLFVSTVQSPLWLLFPGAAISRPKKKKKPAPPAPLIPLSPNVEKTPSTPAPAVVLQTGVFSVEAYARAQSDALRKAGYTPSITCKQVNGSELWAVTVPPGQDVNKTIAELKKAGFDSFPVK
jgi:hypothetical protein